MIRALAACALMLSSVVQPHSAPIEKVGWFSRAPDPVLLGSFDRAKLEELQKSKQAALRDADGFVVQEGRVYYLDFRSAPKFVTDSSRVTQILMFKGKLIALDARHDVYILTEDKGPNTGEWYELGNSTVALETDDVDLFALTSSKAFWTGKVTRGVWVYKGEPGDMQWTLLPIMIPMPCGNSTCFNTILVPTPAGREVAFEDLKIPGAVELSRENGRVFATTEAGAKVPVSRTPQ